MEKKTYRKAYRCTVDVEVECDGWGEDLTRRLAPSIKQIEEAVRHALITYIYTEDIWSFRSAKTVSCMEKKDAPIDILNTPMKDVKVGIIEDPFDEDP